MIHEAYLAGMIDGEGSLGLYFKHKKGKRSIIRWIQPSIEISNTDKRMLKELQKSFGGFINWNHSSAWRLQFLSLADIQRILEISMPFLLIKKEKAQILLSYVKSRQTYSRRTPYSEKEKVLVIQFNAVKKMIEVLES